MKQRLNRVSVLALASGLLTLAYSLFAASPAAASDDPAFGYWLTENKRAIIQIGPCADDAAKACGAIAWMLEPVDAAGKPKTDSKNPDAKLRDRPLCGLVVFGNFKKDGPGDWEKGFAYDAAKGDLYDAYMEIQKDGKLKVRGYMTISLLGKSQIWTRVPDARGGC
ncbi:MAG: DUF2147 domain-containing protein [Neomegalonema sp.]|nr:DUF2147 domain-containing protein [Neomegalonema sp.]